jgi:hypothetical protein
MSLDLSFYGEPRVEIPLLKDFNITHNLVPMAKEVGLYKVLWYPGIGSAEKLLPFLKRAKDIMIRDKQELEKLNPENNWGSYDSFLRTINELIIFCKEYPDATVESSR